jgi:hypothetical protein
VVACTYHVVNFHLFDIRLFSVEADLPPSLVIGLIAKNHRVVRVRQGVVELRVPFIVFDCVRRSGLKQGFGHSRLPIVFKDLIMATRAKPGVDVFIYWSAFRWGDACEWYPGFSPGTHNESTHAENEPNPSTEAEPALRFHIGSPENGEARTTWALERSWRVISFGVDSGQPSGPAFTKLRTGRPNFLRYPSEATDVKMELGVLICSKQPTTHSWSLVIWGLATGNHEDQVERIAISSTIENHVI